MQKYLLIFFMLFVQHAHAHRVGFSSEKWVVKHTLHFDIHHSAEQQDLGLYYANIAETAYEKLAAVFTTHPEKIMLIINDSTDSSNGYATILPYPLIMVYPVQITNQETLSEAGEWARELLTHELTHIFQMYPSSGFYKYLRPVFGSIVSPNLLTPSWWKEGMAIEMETQFSPQGRSRSNLQAATIRALVNDEKISQLTLAEGNETLKTWPYGNRPYFIGSMMMSEIALDGKLAGIGHVVERQSERFPYMLEEPSLEAIDRSYNAEFYKMVDHQTLIASKQIEKLKAEPFTESFNADSTLLSSRHPRFDLKTKTLALIGLKKSGNELLFYSWNDSDKKYVVDSKQKKISGTLGTFEFHPTESKIVFSKIDAVNHKQEFSDLYFYDFVTHEEKQITFSQRAREPQFANNGEDVLFITTEGGQTELKIINLKSEKIESLFKASRKERITEAIDLSSSEVLINIRNSLGEQKLALLNKTNHELTAIQNPHKQIRFIKKSEDKIYFTSTNNGVANIYSTGINNKKLFEIINPETHFLTSALSFDVQGDQIFAAVVGSSGQVVQQINKTTRKIQLPLIENDVASRYNFKSSENETEKQSPQTSDDDYSAWPKVLPHYWIPFVGNSSSNKGLYIQAQTTGQDPLGIHVYQASLSYESYLKKVGFNLDYVNSSFEWQIEALALQSQKVYGVNTQTIFQKNTYALGLIPDVFKISDDLLFSFGALFERLDDDTMYTDHSGYFVQAKYKTYAQKVTQYYPMSGWGVSLQYKNLKAQKDLGPDFGDYNQLLGSTSLYFSKWLPEDHALMFRVDGVYTYEDVRARYGTSTTQFPLIANGLISQFALRGYTAGQFYGSQLFTTNIEYRFPVKDLNRGWGTTPFFIKSLTGAVVVDGLAAKGTGINEFDAPTSITLSEQFWNAGVEAHLSTTLGYFIPLNVILGYYLPFSPAYAKSGQMGLSFQLGGF